MSVNDLINDHSQQGILLKLQYSDEANQLKFRNELTSDRIIWELPLIQEQKAQIKIKADVDITQLDFKDQKQNLICEKNKIQIINQPFDEINTCYLFKKNNDILTDQIEALSPMSPQNKSCFSNGDQCNQKSFYSKSQYNYIKKEKLKRQTQFQRQNNKRSFHENLIFLTKIKKYALKFFDHYQISSRTIYLNSLIRQRINDNSDFVTQRSNKLIITDIQKKQINSFLYKFPLINIQLINPQSNFGFSTQLFFIVYNWIFFYLFSLGVIFDQQIMRFLNIYIIGITVWVIEILLKLNTVIYNYTQKIETREQIFFIYLKQRSIYDIIPALLLYILYIFQEKINLILNIILSLLICLKLKNMSFDINQIQTQFCKRIKKYYLIQMFNLIFKMFMIAHTIGCLWYLIGLYEKKVLNISTWFDQMFEQTEVWWQLYIYSFYWSLQLMIMGSNTATSLLQINFTIFVTFITAITFGYILNVIGMILEELDRNEINKRQDINVINEYMRQKNISMDLQTQINLDLNYFYEKNIKKTQQDVENAVNNLSQEMRMKLKLEQNLQILKRISFFEQNFSQNSLISYAPFLEEETYYPNQTILSTDKFGDSIIFIDSGKVEVTKYCKNGQNYSQCSQVFTEGQYFGQSNFFTSTMSELQCVSKDFTKIVKLNRQKFISVMQNDEKDFELFCQIRDNIQYYDNLREIGETCRNCNNKSHSSLQCPRVHFDKRSEFIRIGVIESKKQSRNEKKRRKYKLNSLNIINHISYVAAEFMNDFQFKYLESALKTETKLGEEEISNKLSDQYSQNFTSILRSEVRHEDFVPTDSTKQNFLSKFKQQTQPILESSLLITQHSQDKTLDEQISLKFLNLSKFTKQLSRQSNENELSSVIEVESSNRQIQEGSSKLEEEQWNDEINFNKSKEQINLKQQQVLQNKYKKKTSTQCFDQRFVSFMDQHANSYEQKDTIFLSPYQIQQNSLSNSFPWNFETQKDFKFYFTQGNLKYLLLRIQKAQIKYLKKKAKKKLKF